jgi:hypothetical protein
MQVQSREPDFPNTNPRQYLGFPKDPHPIYHNKVAAVQFQNVEPNAERQNRTQSSILVLHPTRTEREVPFIVHCALRTQQTRLNAFGTQNAFNQPVSIGSHQMAVGSGWVTSQSLGSEYIWYIDL